jgi:RNA polymerase sigma-70 factor (ECF subfamily)
MEDDKKPVRSTDRTAVDVLRHEELAEAIWRAIDKLPDRRRTTFVLHRQHDMTYSEVAEVMDVSKKTVEHQMGHALKSLREEVPPDLL